jgi:uncharacterized protein YrrD
MLMTGSDLKGLKVISKQTGKEVDSVKDVLYSLENRKIMGVLLSEGLMSNNATFINYGDIKSIGEHAIMIDSDQAIKEGAKDRIAQLKGSDMYKGKKIVTESGDKVGSISDVVFNTDTAQIEKFQISEGLLEEMKGGKKEISANGIARIGEDAIIVKDQVEQSVESQPDQGGLTKLYEQAKDKTEEMKDRYDDKKEENTTGDIRMNDMRSASMSASHPDGYVTSQTQPSMSATIPNMTPPSNAVQERPSAPPVPPAAVPTQSMHTDSVHAETLNDEPIHNATNRNDSLYYDINDLSEQTKSMANKLRQDVDMLEDYVEGKAEELKDRVQ